MSDFDEREGGAAGAGALSHTYDWETTQPSTAVVEMVAISADRDPIDLQPLFDSVDPDALDAIIRQDGVTRTDGDAHVSLRYAGHDVTVRSDGEVAVTPIPADGSEA